MQAKKGTFTITAGTGTQDITDVGFEPDIVLVWGTYQTAEGLTDTVILQFGGSANGVDRSVAIVSDDAVGTSDTNKNRAAVLATVLSDATTPTVGLTMGLNAMLSNGFRINKTVNADGTGAIFHYLCLEGSEITNTHAGGFTVPTTGATFDITGVGFVPDFMLLITNNAGIGNSAHADFMIGAIAGAGKQGVMCGVSEDGRATSDTWVIRRSDSCYIKLIESTGAFDARCSFNAWNSDGVTLNIDDAPAGSTGGYYFALKGGAYDVVNAQITTGTGNQTIAHGVSTPRAVMAFGCHLTTENTSAEQADMRMTIGAGTSSSSRGSSVVHDLDNDTNIVTARGHETDSLIRLITAAATGSSSTENLSADLNSLTSKSLVIAKNVNDGTLLGWFTFVIFGDTEPAAVEKHPIAFGHPALATPALAQVHTGKQKAMF